MARGRMIAKSLSTSQRYAALNQVAGKIAEFCQVLYPLLVAHADDFGRMAGDEFTVKHLVVPTSPRQISDVAKAIGYLDAVGLIHWYTVESRKCIQIRDFDAHQSGLHKRSSSKFPEFPGESGKIPEIPSELNRTELNRTEEKKDRTVRPTASDAFPEGFVNFWATYPRKEAKQDALKAWRQVNPQNGTAEAITADVQARAQSADWTKDGGRFIPMPGTYLRGKRWLDETKRLNPSAPSAREPSRKALEQAAEVRRKAWGGRCNHEQTHASYTECIRALALKYDGQQ